jgi:hypothetical protein
VDSKNLEVVRPANAARFWRKSKKKEKSFSVQQSGIAKSGLWKKKLLKKVKKGTRRITATTH